MHLRAVGDASAKRGYEIARRPSVRPSVRLSCVQWAGSDGPCRFLNIGDADNICDILSP